MLTKYSIVQLIILVTHSVQLGTTTTVGDIEPDTSTCRVNVNFGDKGCVKSKKYFLYDVNPGEGFNLRRDIYIRISPLIAALNRIDTRNEWILVLPPWGLIPHWTSHQYYSWENFFDLDTILGYIPVLELKQYLDSGARTISKLWQLQHFPFDPNDRTWTERIQENAPCQDQFPYKWQNDTNDYTGPFWNSGLRVSNASCMFLRGQASTLVPFLLESNYSSMMFDRAEVILWDNYGGPDWWRARRSLRFSPDLSSLTESILQEIAETTNSPIFKYLGIHLRRRDFVYGRKRLELPSVQGAAKQAFQIAKRLRFQGVFLASDGTDDEFDDFRLAFKILKEDHDSSMILMSLHHSLSLPTLEPEVRSKVEGLTEGQRAIVDQLMCSNASYFIGTPDSTFTLRIFEERELFGFDSDSTFNYLCPDILEEEDVFTELIDCKQPTKWKMRS